jgi:hypothetical protein
MKKKPGFSLFKMAEISNHSHCLLRELFDIFLDFFFDFRNQGIQKDLLGLDSGSVALSQALPFFRAQSVLLEAFQASFGAAFVDSLHLDFEHRQQVVLEFLPVHLVGKMLPEIHCFDFWFKRFGKFKSEMRKSKVIIIFFKKVSPKWNH